MSMVPRIIYDKHCFIQCPKDRCNCRNGNPIEWERQQKQLDEIVKPADPAPDHIQHAAETRGNG